MREDSVVYANMALELLRQLQALTSDEQGAQRVAWTPMWDTARQWFAETAEAAGASVSQDAACNLWATLNGQSAESVIVGSHLDSVPDGGWLDGALGVAAGLALLQSYAVSGAKPVKTLHVVCWADEEGARFGRSCVGSAVVSGGLDRADMEILARRQDREGISFTDALHSYGREPVEMLRARDEFFARRGVAYLELHIEQAPVLESRGQTVAAVYGIAGCRRQHIIFIGQPTHAGAPVALRRDAFLAAAEASLHFRHLAVQQQAYCTVGQVTVSPHVVTIVPGQCHISLDQRSMDAKVLQHMGDAALDISRHAALRNGVKVDFQPVLHITPTNFDGELTRLCAEAVAEETGYTESLFSGPLHDAAEMAKVLPSAMMFVMSHGGISHCKQEDTPEHALQAGLRAFWRWVNKVSGMVIA